MGIKGLWGILTPFSEKKSLHELQGETLAVDLSGWVCDSQNVTDYYVQPKLYLRNLFFRTTYLLLADIKPVFVLEGDAPELKRDVMASRNALQFRGAAPRTETSTKRPDVGRKRFAGVLRECETLLKCMGVSCIKGRGEAEATCAQLNYQRLVDAVISQDSDCFAYGARRVYRNFSVSNAGGGGAMQGSVDCYDADVMFRQNGFGRNKMVALALLCGCDYTAGACGGAVATALAFLHTLTDDEAIPRLVSWVSDPAAYEAKARWLAVSGRCERCGHVGRAHARSGCATCAQPRGCCDTGHKSKVADMKREISLRSRAVTCGMPFPEPKVMKEFLSRPQDEICLDKLKPGTPSLIQFITLMTKKLDWPERYCVEKFLPLLTRWHLRLFVPNRTLRPVKINKKRTPRGVASFEVVWRDINGEYEGVIPDDQFEENEDRLKPWTTIERQDLMQQFYPQLVNEYEESIKKPVKEKKTRKKKEVVDVQKPKRKYNKKVKKAVDSNVDNLSGYLNKMNLSGPAADSSSHNVSVQVNKLKRKIKSTRSKHQKSMSSFLQNKRRKSTIKQSFKLSFEDLKCENDVEFDMITGLAIRNVSCADFDSVPIADGKENINVNDSVNFLDMSEDAINVSDLSDVVEKIVANAPKSHTTKINNDLIKLVFRNKSSTPRKSCFRKSVLNDIQNNCSTPRDSPVRGGRLNNSAGFNVNTSYFFEKLTEGPDVFEMSLNQRDEIGDYEDCDQTVNYFVD